MTAQETIRPSSHVPETNATNRRRETGERHLSKKALVARLAGVLLAASSASSVGFGIKHHVDYNEPLNLQGIERDITSIPGTWVNLEKSILDFIGIGNKPSETFDNKTQNAVINPRINGTPIPHDFSLSEETIGPIEKNTLPRITMIFPAKLADTDNVQISNTTVDQAFNPITQKAEPLTLSKEIVLQRAGTEIFLPLDKAEVFQIDPMIVDNKPYFSGIVIKFKGSDGVLYEMTITAPDDIRQLQPLENIKDAPTLGNNGKYTWGEKTEKKGLELNGMTPLMKTQTDNAHISIWVKAYSDKYGSPLPTTIDFATSNSKILYQPSGK